MKRHFKMVIILVMCIFITGCGFEIKNEQPNVVPEEKKVYTWPNINLLKYSKGVVVRTEEIEDGKGYNIRIEGTNYGDFSDYVSALKVTGFSFYDGYGYGSNEYTGIDETLKIAYWIAKSGSEYVEITFVDSDSTSYNGYNINIYYYTEKPSNWK